MTESKDERRRSNRFPVEQEVRYKMLDPEPSEPAGGHTVDMSGRGVLFTTEQPLPRGTRVQLSVAWPVQLGGTCGLKLVAFGRVVRSDAGRTAMLIDKYEFRTRGARLT
jgi:hypothetical protein